MNIMMLVSIITFVLGIIALILVISNHFQNYRRELIIALTFMFAVSIGAFLTSRSDSTQPSSASTSNPSTATSKEVEESNNLPVSPISPFTSPIPTPEPTITKVDVSDRDFEDCLIFTSNRSGDFEIYKMWEDINTPQQLTTSSGLDVEAVWSPDGAKIAFTSNRESDADFQIYTMEADGSNQQRLGPIQPGENTHPSWSPDGRQIIFQSKRDTNGNPLDDNYDIYLMNSDGTEINFLVIHSAEDTEPSWSLDSSKIAFLSDRSGRDEIYLMNLDGSEITQLTNLNIAKSSIKWADDSQHIVFEGDGEIYSINVVTQEETRLISLEDSNTSTPLWAKDNKLLIFSSDQTGNWELFALTSVSSTEFELAQLTHDPNIDRSPDWFPCDQ